MVDEDGKDMSKIKNTNELFNLTANQEIANLHQDLSGKI
jgi:hypothetical protein